VKVARKVGLTSATTRAFGWPLVPCERLASVGLPQWVWQSHCQSTTFSRIYRTPRQGLYCDNECKTYRRWAKHPYDPTHPIIGAEIYEVAFKTRIHSQFTGVTHWVYQRAVGIVKTANGGAHQKPTNPAGRKNCPYTN
jgi:hypothetical protein